MNCIECKRFELCTIIEEIGYMGCEAYEKKISLCGIIATDQVLRYEEAIRKKPIDIVKERELEWGDV